MVHLSFLTEAIKLALVEKKQKTRSQKLMEHEMSFDRGVYFSPKPIFLVLNFCCVQTKRELLPTFAPNYILLLFVSELF